MLSQTKLKLTMEWYIAAQILYKDLARKEKINTVLQPFGLRVAEEYEVGRYTSVRVGSDILEVWSTERKCRQM